MSNRFLLLALAISPFLKTTRAERCDPRVVSLPFKAQRLANKAETRGLLLGMGTPEQDLSLVLCSAHHDTYVYDESASCNDETAETCMTSRGGLYNRSSSASAKPGFSINHILDGPDAHWTKDIALSVTLESAVTITFATHQLLLGGDPYLDSNGVIQRIASLTNVPIVIMYTDSTEMPRLGDMFFDSAYLIVNHDKSEFTMAPARATPAYRDIVGIDTTHDCVAWLNGTTLLSTSSTPEQDVSAPDSNGSRLATGVIAGISVSAVDGVVSIVIAAFLFWRRRKRNNPSEASGSGPAKDAAEVVEASAAAHIHGAGSGEIEPAVELDGQTRPTELG